MTSKHPVIGMMRTGHSSLPLKIRFNTVNPAPIESEMIRLLEEQFAPGQPGQAEKRVSKRHSGSNRVQKPGTGSV